MRTTRPCVADGRLIPSGSWLIADSSVWDMRAHAAALHGRTWIVPENSGAPTAVVTPRLAIYNPQHGSASDYGWLTLWLERSGFKFKHVTNLDVLHGALGDVTTLLVPHLQADLFSAGAHRQQWPEPYAQGLSDRGASTINSWMQRGGEVVAFGGGATALIQAFDLNINEPLLALNNRDFHNSGAVVRVEPVPNQAMMLGMDEAIPVMHMGNHGYAPGDSAQPLATFGATGTVISGTMHGADRLAGLHAIVRSTQGRGRFTALAFRPHFRTQMLASERLLTAILLGSGIGETKQ